VEDVTVQVAVKEVVDLGASLIGSGIERGWATARGTEEGFKSGVVGSLAECEGSAAQGPSPDFG
jgi:hypothetical protein